MGTVAEKFADRLGEISQTFEVEWQFTGRLYGGVPASEELIRGWIKANMGLEGQELERMVQETLADIAIDEGSDVSVKDLDDADIEGIVDEQEKQTTQVFKIDEDGALILEARQIQAAMRQQQKRLRMSAAGRASDLKNGIWIDPERIKLCRDGEAITEPDGYETRVKHGLPHGGSALARNAYVEGATIRFTLHRLKGIKLAVEDIENIMASCQVAGFGAMHNLGEGRFAVTEFAQQ